MNRPSLLKPAVNQTAFLKAGILGFAGSGKTFTAKNLAIGLASKIGNGKPVAMFDTETGSDYLIPAFKEAGVELLVAKTRSFADLCAFMREAEETCSVAIIDSITHVWQEILTSYTRKLHRRNGLLFQDWGPIKEEWRGFTDLYLNSKMHVILCGRAGFEYDFQTDEAGKKELIKTGTKMKAETEMGYEPSLLLEMERTTPDAPLAEGKRSAWVHRCYVLKDRTDRMNGETIDNPTFESFAPVVGFLNVGGDHLGVDTSRNSDELFDSPESRSDRKRRVEIVLELILDAFVEADMGGTSNANKKGQVKHLSSCFGTSSWTAIQTMPLERLEHGFSQLRAELGISKSVAPLAEEPNGSSDNRPAHNGDGADSTSAAVAAKPERVKFEESAGVGMPDGADKTIGLPF